MEVAQADDNGGREASADADKSLDQISAHINQMISGMLLLSITRAVQSK